MQQGPAHRAATCVLDADGAAELELLLGGALGPPRYLDRRERAAVHATGRLPDGGVRTLPSALAAPPDLAGRLAVGDELDLRDDEGVPVGRVTVTEVDIAEDGSARVAGPVTALAAPTRHAFGSRPRRPDEIRDAVAARGGGTPVAHLATADLHRPGLAAVAAAAAGAPVVLLVPLAAGTATDLAASVRVRGLDAARRALPPPGGLLALVPLDLARTATWRALVTAAQIAGAAGCARLLATRADLDGAHASATADGVDLDALLGDVGVGVEALPRVAYAPGSDEYVVVGGASAAEVRVEAEEEVARLVRAGLPVPRHLALPEVVAELRRLHPPPAERGFTVFFTGLSGSGKSTIATGLAARLLEAGRRVTLLDGDVVRTHLSAGLGFSREDRDRNVRRIGFVAAEVTKHGGTVVCAPIAPYDATRRAVREMVERHGRFVLVHVATPLEVCERRDRKGLYARARAGEIPEFTGVSDPYEPPADAEVVVDTGDATPSAAVEAVLGLLADEGLVARPDGR